MKFLIAASLIAAASAFAPAQSGKASTALKADYSNELGAIAPVGFFGKLVSCFGVWITPGVRGAVPVVAFMVEINLSE